MKYGIWNVSQPEVESVNALVSCGYKPLTAMILASRGISTGADANQYICCDAPLHDPFMMTDMDLAVSRVALAISNDETIAVFGPFTVNPSAKAKSRIKSTKPSRASLSLETVSMLQISSQILTYCGKAASIRSKTFCCDEDKTGF